MALVPIKNQPVMMQPFPEETFMCDRDEFCLTYSNDVALTDDFITLQMKQTPCGDDLVTDGNFTEDNYLPYWTFTYGYWQINDNGTETEGSATKIPGSAGTLTQSIIPASSVVGDYYKLTYTITGMTAGTLTVLLGDNTSRIVTENGTYTDYTTLAVLTNQLLSFSADSTFDGNVSGVSCYQLLADFTAAALLIDLDGNEVEQLSYEIDDDRVNFSTGQVLNLAEGCYRIAVIDNCFDYINIIGGTEIMGDPLINNAAAWEFVVDAASVVVSGGKMTITTGAGNNDFMANDTTSSAQVSPTLIGLTKLIRITIVTGAIASLPIAVNVYTADNSGLAQTNLIATIPYLSANATHSIQVAHTFDANAYMILLEFVIDTNLASQVNEILSVSIKHTDLDAAVEEYGYRSNCIKVVSDLGNKVKIRGRVVDSDTLDSTIDESSMGFKFSEDFPELWMYIDLSFTNPHRPIKQDTYLYSTGSKKKTFATLDKAWDLVIHAVDENAHDVISTILNMEYCYINGNRYICEDKEYSADWAKGEASVAEAVVEVSRVGDVIFK